MKLKKGEKKQKLNGILFAAGRGITTTTKTGDAANKVASRGEEWVV